MLSECVARVHNFRFTSLEFIYFCSLDIRARCLLTMWPTFVLQLSLCPFRQTIEHSYIVNLCKQSSLFAKNIIRRKFSWFQIEKIRQKSPRLSVSELAISGFWDLEITNFRSPDIRAKCLICFFSRIRLLNSPQDILRDVYRSLNIRAKCLNCDFSRIRLLSWKYILFVLLLYAHFDIIIL